ncbi:hypothetical protein GIB67_007959, partial [Kingdonia uniflora]
SNELGHQGDAGTEEAASNKAEEGAKTTTMKSWASLLSVPSKGRGKILLLYTPVSGDELNPIVDISGSDFGDEYKKFENYLVGSFIGKKLAYLFVKETLSKMWALIGDFKMSTKGFSMYFFKFTTPEDREKALDTGSQHIASILFILRPWRPFIEVEHFDLSTIPIWVVFKNVPINMRNYEGLGRIVSSVGIPLYLDRATEDRGRDSFSRVCVDVNTKCKFPEVITLNYSNGQLPQVFAEYAWYPLKCSHCGVFGHNDYNCEHCPKLKQPKRDIKRLSRALKKGVGQKEYKATTTTTKKKSLMLRFLKTDPSMRGLLTQAVKDNREEVLASLQKQLRKNLKKQRREQHKIDKALKDAIEKAPLSATKYLHEDQVEDPEFVELVKEGWETVVTRNPMYCFVRKMKEVKKRFKAKYASKGGGLSDEATILKLYVNCLIHHLWRERNNRVFNNLYTEAPGLLKTILSDVKLKFVFSERKMLDTVENRFYAETWGIRAAWSTPVISHCSWKMPSNSTCMINCSGNSMGGYGAIIQIAKGSAVAVCAGRTTTKSMLFHELMSIKVGLELAVKHGKVKNEVCTQSTMAVSIIIKQYRPDWQCRAITREILLLTENLEWFRIYKIPKEANQPAITLSRLRQELGFEEVRPTEFSEELKQKVKDDADGKTNVISHS